MIIDEPAAAEARRSLLRVLGLVFGLAVVVGSVIGSGIMRAPGVVALGITSGPLILAAWAIGGGVAVLSAMPLVEAGASVPRAGGQALAWAVIRVGLLGASGAAAGLFGFAGLRTDEIAGGSIGLDAVLLAVASFRMRRARVTR